MITPKNRKHQFLVRTFKLSDTLDQELTDWLNSLQDPDDNYYYVDKGVEVLSAVLVGDRLKVFIKYWDYKRL